ncbi:aldo/keto reductase [Geomonas sp. RF6]|uniref:aldo/keto reductase n=1 Tax=Geomonas sp. RF6 TaxID=2897342 RepID=UPI001E3B2614|nr:aldo/keto reductase [Geomonas sp. RF6]UFS70910.1 aldo/keto reductase [Geomonas sp. RF6]
MAIPKRKLGKTGEEVTILGLGGEGILRTFGLERDAYALINRALDLGITYCESARAYQGSESYYGKALKERRKEIFLTSKSHARDKDGALEHLHETLHNMGTDHIDLWQVHDVRTRRELEEIFGPGGAIEAFVEAKEQGKVRFIGVTGHHDPAILRSALELFPFDTVLMPVNPAEASHKSFVEGVLPHAMEREMGIVGMKVYLRGLASRVPGYQSMEPYLRYALSHPVSTVVIGCDDLRQVEQNVLFATRFEQMTDEEMGEIVEYLHPFARQLMYYKP